MDTDIIEAEDEVQDISVTEDGTPDFWLSQAAESSDENDNDGEGFDETGFLEKFYVTRCASFQ